MSYPDEWNHPKDCTCGPGRDPECQSAHGDIPDSARIPYPGGALPPIPWLVWSIEHQAWWKPNRSGYTQKKEEAGRYEFYEAWSIVLSANEFSKENPNESMVPVIEEIFLPKNHPHWGESSDRS